MVRFWGMSMALVVGEGGDLYASLHEGKVSVLERLGGEPSKLKRGAVSCDNGLIVWRGEQSPRMVVVGHYSSWDGTAHYR